MGFTTAKLHAVRARVGSAGKVYNSDRIMRVILPKKITLRGVNRVLTAIIFLLAVYIAAAPFLPEVSWWAQHSTPIKAIVPPANVEAIAKGTQAPAITGDVLVIPRLGMQEIIHGGGMISLRYGVWRLPYTSAPDKGGNTVLVGHRFTYTEPRGVFYYLDKVQVGDLVTAYWNSKPYQYVVTSVSVVPPDDLAVEAKTESPRLTLYTCTPLWSAKNRLVIVAEPVKDPQ